MKLFTVILSKVTTVLKVGDIVSPLWGRKRNIMGRKAKEGRKGAIIHETCRTFFIFFGLHLILGGKLVVCGRADL